MMNIDLMDKIEKRIGLIFIGMLILGLSLTGFVIWVIIKLLTHYGVI